MSITNYKSPIFQNATMHLLYR